MDPLSLPKLEQFVNDFSGLIPEAKRIELNELFATHEKNTTEQVVVVLFPHREGNELIDIGMKIFHDNGIGQKWQNNGLLLIISTEEKKIRLITGKGMEIKYSEMRCRDIIENHLRPLLNSWKYEELIGDFAERIQETNNTTESKNESVWYSNIVEEKEQFMRRVKYSVYWALAYVISLPFLSLLLPFPMNVSTILISIWVWLIIWSYFLLKHEGTSYKILWGIIFLLSLVFIIPNVKTYFCYGKTDLACRLHIESYNSSPSDRWSVYRDSSSSSDWGTDSSSSSDWGGSSYGGGGGSSNGGGYGD